MTRDELKALIGSRFDNKLTLSELGKFDPLFEVKPADLVEVARKLRDDDQLRFDYCNNIGAVDTTESFWMVYSLSSTTFNLRMDLKVTLSHDNPEVDSVQEVWVGANWYEREAWELYGINIRNHGNLTRFLLPDEWDQGHPMRKDWDAPDFVRMPEL